MAYHADGRRSHQHGPATRLPPSPPYNNSPHKHTRNRSGSWEPTFVSSTVVPAPEALNSLITSLTALSDSTKQQLVSVQQIPETHTGYYNDPRLATSNPHHHFQQPPDPDPGIDELIYSISQSAAAFNQDYERVDLDYDDPEDEPAPAPVAGYATRHSSRNKSTSKEARGFPGLRSKPSDQGFRPSTSASTRSIGVPSIHRMRTGSTPSIAPSTFSKESKSRRSFRMLFSSSRSNHQPSFSTSSGMVEPRTLSQQHSLSSLRGDLVETPTPRPLTPSQRPRRTSTIGEDTTGEDAIPEDTNAESTTAESTTEGSTTGVSTNGEYSHPEPKHFAHLNPALRSELNDHLIPSRRSSMRLNQSNSVANGLKNHLTSDSRDLRSLNIDEELITGDNSTVRRIMELQKAREQRHSEWRKEAKRSERNAKRMSLPSQNPPKRANSMHSSRHSMSSIVVENPEQEFDQLATARIDGKELASIPALVEIAEGGLITPTEDKIDFKHNLNGSPAPNFVNAKKMNRFSGGIRRSLSLRLNGHDDYTSVAEEVDAFLNAPRFTQKIKHPRTGRTIAFSEVGDPNGYVVLCCVGMGLTRFVTTFYDEVARTQKLRIITPDRPGVGESSPVPEGTENPLGWVDDVAVICSALNISRFSLLAHSAGALYALATALKMPQCVRGRVHLLAPWIPPSQLAISGRDGDLKAANLPTSHRLLTMLPTSFMKAANSRFLSSASASMEPKSRKDRKKEQAALASLAVDVQLANNPASVSAAEMSRASMLPTPEITPQRLRLENDYLSAQNTLRSPPLSPASFADVKANTLSPSPRVDSPTNLRSLTPQARTNLYNATLTRRTWALSTLNSNPALDLIICLERRRPIAFSYLDIVRSVVIHHGRKDNRVPLENVVWLSRAMRRCELRILDDEEHGLMASAKVMSSVFTEIGREWEEWSVISTDKERKRVEKQQTRGLRDKERDREVRRAGIW